MWGEEMAVEGNDCHQSPAIWQLDHLRKKLSNHLDLTLWNIIINFIGVLKDDLHEMKFIFQLILMEAFKEDLHEMKFIFQLILLGFLPGELPEKLTRLSRKTEYFVPGD